MKNNIYGFTLMEMLLVMAIIAIIAGAFFTNLFSSIARGRDGRRKEDLRSISQALELYYNDNRQYPDALPPPDVIFSHPDNIDTIYMQKIPDDPKADNDYCYATGGGWYSVYANLENSSDSDVLPDLVNCGGADYNYGISITNVTP